MDDLKEAFEQRLCDLKILSGSSSMKPRSCDATTGQVAVAIGMLSVIGMAAVLFFWPAVVIGISGAIYEKWRKSKVESEFFI